METLAIIETPLMIKLQLPEDHPLGDDVELYHDDVVTITLLQNEHGKSAQSEMVDFVDRALDRLPQGISAKNLVNTKFRLLRTLLLPTLRLEFTDSGIKKSDLVTNAAGKIELNRAKIHESAWYAIHTIIETILSTLANALYLVTRNPEALALSTEIQYKYSTPTPYRFLFLENQVKVLTVEGKHYGPPKFEILPEQTDSDFINLLSNVELPTGAIDQLKLLIAEVNPTKPRWNLQQHYMLLSQEHQRFSDLRLAIIDMDIAIDICIRRYLQCKSGFEQMQFDMISKGTSTGDLLKAARLMSAVEDQSRIIAFEELHNLRNTILHRYQRAIGKDEQEILENARESLWSLMKAIA